MARSGRQPWGAGRRRRPRRARSTLRRALADLDRRLAEQRYLLGNVLTEADVRLWVTLVRFDVGPNADRQIVDGLHDYPNLWAYARDLYAIPAFRDSTDFESFARAAAVVPEWDAPATAGRSRRLTRLVRRRGDSAPAVSRPVGGRLPPRPGRVAARGARAEWTRCTRCGTMPAFLQPGDQQLDDVVEAVGHDVRRDVESVDRPVAGEMDELVGEAGRCTDVPARRAGRGGSPSRAATTHWTRTARATGDVARASATRPRRTRRCCPAAADRHFGSGPSRVVAATGRGSTAARPGASAVPG